jgi:hypothetical protein
MQAIKKVMIMPTTETHRQRRSRLRIERMLRDINTGSINLDLLRKLRDESKQNLKEFLERHEFFVKATSGQRFQFTILNLVLFFVYILDFIACSAVCEYMASVANLSSRETIISRILVPLMVIGIEITIDALRQYYSDDVSDKGGYRAISILFLFVAILMTFAMPGLFIGTQLASRYSDPTHLPSIVFYTILCSLGILILAGHCTILYSFMAGFEAKSYLFFLIMRRKFSRRHNNYETSAQNTERQLVSNFQSYLDMIAQHNKQFSDKLTPGSFTKIARKIINELFGREIISASAEGEEDDDDDDDDDDEGPDDGGGGGGYPPFDGPDGTGHHDVSEKKGDSIKETSTDDDPIFAPSRAEWDPFRRG